MDNELENGLNNAPYCPMFEAKSDRIVIVNPVFWDRLGGGKVYKWEIGIPVVVLDKLQVDLDNYYVLALFKLPPYGNLNKKLEEVIFISKSNLAFPIKERHAEFDSAIENAKLEKCGEQGNLKVYEVRKYVPYADKKYAIERNEYLFFNHMILKDDNLTMMKILRKDNKLLLWVEGMKSGFGTVKIFSWEHFDETLILFSGIYLLEHPLPQKEID